MQLGLGVCAQRAAGQMAAVGDRQCRPGASNVARRPRPRPVGHPGADRRWRADRPARRLWPARRFVAGPQPIDEPISWRRRDGDRATVRASGGRCAARPSRSARRPSTSKASRGCAGFKPEAILAATAARARSTSTSRSPSARRRSAGLAPTSMPAIVQLSDFGTLTSLGAGLELGAERAAQLHRQLDSRRRRAQPATSSAIR